MTQDNLFEPIALNKFEQLTKEELIQWVIVQQKANEHILNDNKRLRALNGELQERTLLIEDQYIVLRNRYFGKSSEKSNETEEANPNTPPKPKRKRVQLPSERYPDLPRIERHVEFKDLPDCKCCGVKLKDFGMTEDSEYLTVIPKEYIIIQQKRHKYRCEKCHGDLQTAPAPPRIKEGSSYSDEMMVDVAMSKYCDLIPVERYTKIAERSGVPELPPQSLIETTHYVAELVKPAYWLLKAEILAEKVLHADETPHRMLEGDDKSNWYLWGFSSKKSSYFEAHNTRSGDVASGLLQDSACEFLVSDVFSGYGKAVRVANQLRLELNLELIQNIYCNSHSRRKFKDSELSFPDDSKFFIEQYRQIYRLEAEAKEKPPDQVLELRKQMTLYFNEMKNMALALLPAYSTKSSIGKAMNYFLKNYRELTIFIGNAYLPIDNNSQERLLRNPVIGRKTWYGTHSKRGADTMAILFSIVESCKLNKVNPREYIKQLVQDLQQGKKPYTPKTFKLH